MIIHASNFLLLVLLLLGLPAATSQRLGPWHLSDPKSLRWLTLAGLALAAALNGLAWYWARGKKTRHLCLGWFAAHLALILLQWLMLQQILDFQWLKKTLLWLQNRLSGT